jgi:hypothetical protein
MSELNEKKARLRRYFNGKPIVWVPFWGISKLRRRGRSFAGEIPGDMISYDQWYARMLSAETFDQLADMGVNLVILPFSLGGSAEHEAQEHEDFRQAAALCAERKITALPYLQYQNVLQESTPCDFTKYAVSPEGGRTGYAYYRRTLCQSSGEFQDYFKEVIRKAQERGADGLWIDNSYLRPCLCPECKARFVNFLREERAEMLEDLHLIPEKVEIPFNIAQHSLDPVMQAYHEFNMKQNLENMRIFRDEMLKYNPQGLFASNPGLHRGLVKAFAGMDAVPFVRLHDIIYIENGQVADVDEGVRTGNYRAFADCEAAGTVAVSGAWRHRRAEPGEYFHSEMPEPHEIVPAVFEGMLNGNMTGAYWLIRETPDKFCSCGDDKVKGYFEHPPMKERLKELFATVAKLPGESFNPADTGVLYVRDSWKFDYFCFEESRYAITEALSSANIPWRTIIDLEEISKLKLLIVPMARVMSDEFIDALKKAAAGVQVLVVGADAAYFNENKLRRNDSPLAQLAGSSRYSKEAVSSCGNWHLLRDDGKRGSLFQRLYPSETPMRRTGYLLSGDLVKMVRELNPPAFTAECDVAVTVRQTPEGREYMLFLDYMLPERESCVKVNFGRVRKGVFTPLKGDAVTFESDVLEIPEFRSFGYIEFSE